VGAECAFERKSSAVSLIGLGVPFAPIEAREESCDE
jgi:hypothetical protein